MWRKEVRHGAVGVLVGLALVPHEGFGQLVEEVLLVDVDLFELLDAAEEEPG